MRAPRAASIGVVLATGLLACTSYFHTYEAMHPGWEFSFPREGMPLDELVASIFAPRRYAPYGDGHVKTVRIFDTREDPPSEIRLDALESGAFQPDASGDYLVGVRVSCTHPTQDAAWIGEGFFWYFLESNSLVAYQQASFWLVCMTRDPKELSPAKLDAERRAWLRSCLTGRCS